MDEQALSELEATTVAEIDVALEHPDPDPDLIPAIPPGWHPASQQAAEHLCRAILRGETELEDLEARARADALAWAQEIRVAKARVEERRAVILAFLVRHDCRLKTPWFSAWPQKHQDGIIVHDPDRAIAVCKARGWTEGVRTKEEVAKQEFDVLFHSDPEAFEAKGPDGMPIAEAVPREPSLVIKRKGGSA